MKTTLLALLIFASAAHAQEAPRQVTARGQAIDVTFGDDQEAQLRAQAEQAAYENAMVQCNGKATLIGEMTYRTSIGCAGIRGLAEGTFVCE